MQYRVPCIGSRSGGVPEIITHNKTGWLFTPKSTQELAQQMSTVWTLKIHSPDSLNEITENALRMVYKRFTLDAQLGALTTCYTSVQSTDTHV